MSAAIRVLVADDQRVVREGLGTLLGLIGGIEVVGTAADGNEALDLAIRTRPDVVLMDLRMPHCDGVEATRRLRDHDVGIKVLVLTTYADDRSVIDALRAGARGYLTKDVGADGIRDALERVMQGQAVIDPAVQQHLLAVIAAGQDGQSGTAPPLPDGLTTREADTVHQKVYIQDLFTSGQLEERLGQLLDPQQTHVYLCGNPKMIGVPTKDRETGQRVFPQPTGVIEILEQRGFQADQPQLKIKGNIHFEEYW